MVKADYNLATKILWARRPMPKAEKSKLLTDSNCGSRRNQSTQDTSTVKELHYDLSHLRLQDYTSMENDAKSCYDRMVVSLIMLTSRSFGISKGMCQAVGKTFQITRHYLSTRNGISEQSFGYSQEEPIFGSWQDATKSVVDWALMSSIIQKIHQALVEGASFKSTEDQTEVSQTTVGFVDDNNNRVSQDKDQGPSS